MTGITINFLGEAVVVDGNPEKRGIYAAEVYFGWKLLEWHDGAWWHEAKVGRWMAGDPVQWVGPLPTRMKHRTVDYDL